MTNVCDLGGLEQVDGMMILHLQQAHDRKTYNLLCFL